MNKKIIYIILLYIFLFSPPVGIGPYKINLGWLLWPISVGYVLSKPTEFGVFLGRFKVEFSVFIYLLAFAFLRAAAGGDISLFMTSNLFSLFTLFTVPFFLIEKGKSISTSLDDNISYILIACTIAVIITMLCLSIPAIDDIVRNKIIKYRDDELGSEWGFRNFGFGAHLTSHYSFVIGMIVAIGIFFRKRWFYFVIPFAILACMVNARTGVIVAFSGILVYFFRSRSIWASLLVSILGILTWTYLGDMLIFFGANEDTLRWTGVFATEMDSIASGDVKETTFGFIWTKMFVMPKDAVWLLFGNGYSLFGGRVTEYGYLISDIGFVNHLCFGGLFYVIPLYYLVFRVCSRFRRYGFKLLSYFIIIAFFIINFKGQFVLNTTCFSLTLFLYYLVDYFDRRKRLDKSKN